MEPPPVERCEGFSSPETRIFSSEDRWHLRNNFLRGLGGPRLGIVMNDSLEVSGANHGTDPATSYIQPDAHDHVTVVKGPNSVLYGSSMGGLVIFNELPKRFDKPGVQARAVGAGISIACPTSHRGVSSPPR